MGVFYALFALIFCATLTLVLIEFFRPVRKRAHKVKRNCPNCASNDTDLRSITITTEDRAYWMQCNACGHRGCVFASLRHANGNWGPH